MGSIFSMNAASFLEKTKALAVPSFDFIGTPIPDVQDVDVVRHAVLELSVQSGLRRKERVMIPPSVSFVSVELHESRLKVADSAGTELTGGQLLTEHSHFTEV